MPQREQLPILRMIRIQARPGEGAALERILPDDVRDRLRGAAGLVGWYLCRPINGDLDAYAVITIWRNKGALRAFAGVSTPTPALRGEPVSELSTEQFELFASSWPDEGR